MAKGDFTQALAVAMNSPTGVLSSNWGNPHQQSQQQAPQEEPLASTTNTASHSAQNNYQMMGAEGESHLFIYHNVCVCVDLWGENYPNSARLRTRLWKKPSLGDWVSSSTP